MTDQAERPEQAKLAVSVTVGKSSRQGRVSAVPQYDNVACDMTLPNLKSMLNPVLFAVILIVAASIRFWAAPLSAGPDVAQFWAFANVFQHHGLDFYRYADATLDLFPFYGWGFVYPPIWLFVLGMALLFVPGSSATSVMVDTGWRIAMKTPIIAADLAIGCLLYWAVPGSRWHKLFFASLWLLHPTAWYESAVFGQFDAIAAALLLASVILLARGNDKWAFVLAALAMMTKQHTLAAIAVMVVISARHLSRRQFRTDFLIAGGVVTALSVPFLLDGNLHGYVQSVFLPGAAPAYQYPLCFAFSGSGTLLTYLHDVFGWETGVLLPLTIPVLLIALVITAVVSYRTEVTPLQGALAGFLVFVAFSYRVNYQYLVVYIPLAILLASRTRYLSERISALVLAVLPAAWLWFGNVPWWFHNLEPTYNWVTPLLARVGLLPGYLPDGAYVSFAVLLMCLALAHVVLTFTRWRHRAVVETD